MCCPSLGTHGGHRRGRPLGLDVAQLVHRGLEILTDNGGKWMQTRGAYESSEGYFPESKGEELLRTRGNSCMPPFLPGYSGPNLEASSHVEFLLTSRACQADHHGGHGSTWFRPSKLSFFPEAFLQGSQACQQQGFQVASTHRECSLPNWKARMFKSGPRFHAQTQHTLLLFLTSQKRHMAPCVCLPESASRSRGLCIKWTASTKERPSYSSGACCYSEACIPTEEAD